MGWISLENIKNILEESLTVHIALLFQPLYSYKLTAVLNFHHTKIICRDKYIPILYISNYLYTALLNVFLI